MGWKDYGARGISVCARWADFPTFLADMGERPSKDHSIERIDVDGNYEPANCRWATRVEQQRNRRITKTVEHNGERKSLAEWAERAGLPYPVLFKRLHRYGWPIERALAEPKHMRSGR